MTFMPEIYLSGIGKVNVQRDRKVTLQHFKYFIVNLGKLVENLPETTGPKY